MRGLSITLACLGLSCCKHVPEPEPEYNIPETNIKLEDFFFPAANGAEYHPRANRPPPFWPPHEHHVDVPVEFPHVIRFPITSTVN